MKTCSKCGTARSLSEFSPLRHTSDGLQSNCKPCRAAHARARYAVSETEVARKARYRAANVDLRMAYNRQWNAANADAERARKRLTEGVRRARRRSALVIAFTSPQLAARLSMFAGCWICRAASSEVDHVKPLAAGGAHILANLRPICGPCNRRKWSHWPVTRDALARP